MSGSGGFLESSPRLSSARVESRSGVDNGVEVSYGLLMTTEKQAAFIEKLCVERGVEQGDVSRMTTGEASQYINSLLAMPKVASASASSASAPGVDVPKVGMYHGPAGRIFRVYLGQQSGRNLVKQLVSDGEGTGGYTWQYVGSALTLAKQGKIVRPMTLDEAVKFGKMTQTCVCCGRRLDDPKSVDAGIGPVCAQKFGE